MPLQLRTLDTFDDPDAALAAYFASDARGVRLAA